MLTLNAKCLLRTTKQTDQSFKSDRKRLVNCACCGIPVAGIEGGKFLIPREVLSVSKAQFKRRTFHVSYLLLISKILCSNWFAFDSADEKCEVWIEPDTLWSSNNTPTGIRILKRGTSVTYCYRWCNKFNGRTSIFYLAMSTLIRYCFKTQHFLSVFKKFSSQSKAFSNRF